MAAGVLGMAFIPYYNQLMEILSTNDDMRKSAKGIFKQVAYGACGTAVGGVVGGPLGAMVGGLAGSVIGYMQSDEYDSMINVLMNMSDSEKKRLVQKVQELVGGTGIEALTRFIGNQAQREVLLHLIQGFAKNPQGLVIGYMLSDDYDSMINVLMNMSNSEKERLVQKVQELVGDTEIEALTRLIIGNKAQRKVLLHLIQGFAKNAQGE